MPAKPKTRQQDPLQIALRGTAAYGRYLDRLSGRLGTATRSELAERALAELGARLGLEAPRRCRPLGTNRYGEPGA